MVLDDVLCLTTHPVSILEIYRWCYFSAHKPVSCGNRNNVIRREGVRQ